MKIDINCDVGEGIGNEAGLFPFISSCNIACGGHAGDPTTMLEVAELAARHGLKTGAHPSYPDRENFGRSSMKMPASEFISTIRSQITALLKILRQIHWPLSHIKPHGALYNDLTQNAHLASEFIEAVQPFCGDITLYVPFGSVIAHMARDAGIPIYREAFLDRRYAPDYSLVSRDRNDALIEEPEEVLQQLLLMVKNSRLITISGSRLPINADTYCIHGDTANALQILMYLSTELPRNGIYLKE